MDEYVSPQEAEEIENMNMIIDKYFESDEFKMSVEFFLKQMDIDDGKATAEVVRYIQTKIDMIALLESRKINCINGQYAPNYTNST